MSLGTEVSRSGGYVLRVRPLWRDVFRLYELLEDDEYAPGRYWCYRSALAAVAAAKVWDRETQDAPVGWFDKGGVAL